MVGAIAIGCAAFWHVSAWPHWSEYASNPAAASGWDAIDRLPLGRSVAAPSGLHPIVTDRAEAQLADELTLEGLGAYDFVIVSVQDDGSQDDNYGSVSNRPDYEVLYENDRYAVFLRRM